MLKTLEHVSSSPAQHCRMLQAQDLPPHRLPGDQEHSVPDPGESQMSSLSVSPAFCNGPKSTSITSVNKTFWQVIQIKYA